MNFRSVFMLGVAVVWAGLTTVSALAAPAAPPPNIVFILADDLGYGDLGCFGQQKIKTPNLDRMAAEGMRLTQHYSGNAVCAPSRCVLLTGKHPGHAWIRDNREVQPEGQPPLPAGTVTLPRLLKKHGYATGIFGKWGLGFPDAEGDPLEHGFDRFFGYNCQRHAHNHYPTYLRDNRQKRALKNPTFAAHQKWPPDTDPAKPENYQRYAGEEYAPDLIREEALRFIRENQAQPFFLYFASTVPHLALQVPEDSLREYTGQWNDPPYTGGKNYLPHFTPRAAYAAMITRLDRDAGQLWDLIRSLGLDENTIFVFSSDNGPVYDRLGGTDSEFFNSAAGLRGFKGSLYEGGIRVPTLVRWRGKIPAGSTSDRVTGFEDWLPTLLELAGFKQDLKRDELHFDGISLAPTLLGKTQKPRPFLYREFPGYGGQQSIRVGDWKAIRRGLNPRGKAAAEAAPAAELELYNLRSDPGETQNVAASHPKVVARLERLLREQHTPSKLFPMPALDHPTPE
jgi:arylsulfatase A